MDLEIIDFEYLHAISDDNIFHWKNDVSFEYNQNTQIKKIRIENMSFITIAQFSYRHGDNHEKTIKLLPRSVNVFGHYIYSKSMIDRIIEYPPLAMYADTNLFEEIIKRLIQKWGIKKVLNSIEKLSLELYYNYNEKVFCSKALLYLYKKKSWQLYRSGLEPIYGKDLTSILRLYIDYEN